MPEKLFYIGCMEQKPLVISEKKLILVLKSLKPLGVFESTDGYLKLGPPK